MKLWGSGFIYLYLIGRQIELLIISLVCQWLYDKYCHEPLRKTRTPLHGTGPDRTENMSDQANKIYEYILLYTFSFTIFFFKFRNILFFYLWVLDWRWKKEVFQANISGNHERYHIFSNSFLLCERPRRLVTWGNCLQIPSLFCCGESAEKLGEGGVPSTQTRRAVLSCSPRADLLLKTEPDDDGDHISAVAVVKSKR